MKVKDIYNREIELKDFLEEDIDLYFNWKKNSNLKWVFEKKGISKMKDLILFDTNVIWRLKKTYTKQNGKVYKYYNYVNMLLKSVDSRLYVGMSEKEVNDLLSEKYDDKNMNFALNKMLHYSNIRISILHKAWSRNIKTIGDLLVFFDSTAFSSHEITQLSEFLSSIDPRLHLGMSYEEIKKYIYEVLGEQEAKNYIEKFSDLIQKHAQIKAIEKEEINEKTETNEKISEEDKETLIGLTIDKMNLDTRTYHGLMRNGIDTLYDVLRYFSNDNNEGYVKYGLKFFGKVSKINLENSIKKIDPNLYLGMTQKELNDYIYGSSKSTIECYNKLVEEEKAKKICQDMKKQFLDTPLYLLGITVAKYFDAMYIPYTLGQLLDGTCVYNSKYKSEYKKELKTIIDGLGFDNIQFGIPSSSIIVTKEILELLETKKEAYLNDIKEENNKIVEQIKEKEEKIKILEGLIAEQAELIKLKDELDSRIETLQLKYNSKIKKLK